MPRRRPTLRRPRKQSHAAGQRRSSGTGSRLRPRPARRRSAFREPATGLGLRRDAACRRVGSASGTGASLPRSSVSFPGEGETDRRLSERHHGKKIRESGRRDPDRGAAEESIAVSQERSPFRCVTIVCTMSRTDPPGSRTSWSLPSSRIPSHGGLRRWASRMLRSACCPARSSRSTGMSNASRRSVSASCRTSGSSIGWRSSARPI